MMERNLVRFKIPGGQEELSQGQFLVIIAVALMKTEAVRK